MANFRKSGGGGRGFKKDGDKSYPRKKVYTSHTERDEDKKSEKKSYSDDDRGEKKSYGDKKPFGEKKSYGDKKEFGEKRSYGDKKEFGEKKSYGDKKPFGEKRSYGDKKEFGEKKSYGDKKEFGEKRSYSDKKPFGEKRSFGDKKEFGEKRSYGDKKEFGEKKSYGDKKPFGEKRSYGDKKEFGEKDSYRDKKSFPPSSKDFGGRGGDKKEFGEKKSYGDKKPFGEKRTYGGKKEYGDKKPFAERNPYERKSFEKKPYERKFDEEGLEIKNPNYGLPYKKKPYEKKEGYIKRESKSFSSKRPRKTAAATEPKIDDGRIRLNKYLSNSGICSRREADDLIKAGAVTVNGIVVTEMGHKITLDDVVNYGGGIVKKEKKVYLLLNKPKDYITTTDDPQERKTVMELIRGACKERLYPVGRLDRNTTGVLLFTNDGDLTTRLTHPKHEIKKVYQVSLDKNLRGEDMIQIKEGIDLEDGPIVVDKISIVGDGKDRKEVGIEIHSGRNRIVRRIFEQLGYEVIKLDRVYFGGLTKKDLPKGRWRFLEEKEVSFLKMV